VRSSGSLWPAWPPAASSHCPRRPRPARLPARHHPAPLQRQALDLVGVGHRLGGAKSAARPAQPEEPGKRAPAPVTGGDFGVA